MLPKTKRLRERNRRLVPKEYWILMHHPFQNLDHSKDLVNRENLPVLSPIIFYTTENISEIDSFYRLNHFCSKWEQQIRQKGAMCL